MLCIDVPESEYIVFEHGAFDYENQSISVGKKLEQEIMSFDFSNEEYEIDEKNGRISYRYHDPEKFQKIIKPVIKK